MELQDILALVKAGFTRAELLDLVSEKSVKSTDSAEHEELTLHDLDAKIQVMADAIKVLANQQGANHQHANIRHDDMGGDGTLDQRTEATSALAMLMGRPNKEG